MNPEHVMCVILLSKIAIENLFLVNEATEWGQKAVELTGHKNKKALIIYGSSMCIKAKLQKQQAVQKECYEKALDSFRKAHSLDPSDFLPLYHIAHCHAILRQINKAIDHIQLALKLKPDDKDSMHLLALLLTSTKNYDEAHTIICKSCALYDDCELLFTKIKIEEILYDFNQTVASFLSLIVIFKQSSLSNEASAVIINQQQGSTRNYATPGGGGGSAENWSTFEAASLLSLQHNYKLNETIGKTSTMLLEADQLALKYGYSHVKSHEIQQILVLVRILTQIGEFYLRHEKLNDAEQCCQEISVIHPMSYLHIYLKGRIFEFKQDYLQAKLCYQNALSINPHHISSLQQMAIVLCRMQNFHLAEKMIRDAISLNSSLPDSWHILARILDYQNDNQSAMKCYQTCLQLEATAPILPFSSLTRIL
jgi:tetratricopeptide repeat protein 7